ncbi:uncharacterized protein LOC129926968 isoform X1 [Biomphalaria glabrata]|uniref:Uncharacterized protein LOC129926968 isoform X1 n=1 Tax=Biomphalaria glabrata TaxID=6526 RepID=A0A9W3ARH8_BIOGL|nr:uncharacterized protein LOC129926968 isoform X1 [Biomphalaria glabrata]XP_055889820.1 uncharacterized protein LOC129926968 isoform X1 [Biomphalaria glabrata]
MRAVLSLLFITILMLHTDLVTCQTTNLIKSFTVNGASQVIITEGSLIKFEATKLDNVSNPVWTIRAASSGQYIFGGSGFTVISQSVSNSVAATSSMNGTVECQAKVGNDVDIKTVLVIVTKLKSGDAGNDATSQTVERSTVFLTIFLAYWAMKRL